MTHVVRVRLGPASTGHVWIDGVEVPHLTRVCVEGAVREATRVTLELIATELDVEVEVDRVELETAGDTRDES